MSINPTRLKEVETRPLHKGNGKDLDHACIMQMVAYVANEPWSDHPECASRVLTNYAISLNDRLSDKRRQGLAPLIPLLVGTNVPSLEKVRANFLMWRMLTVTFPIFTDSLNLPEISAKLRATQNSIESMREIAAYLRQQKETIRKAAYAAYAAAYAAAAAAAAAADAADAAADAYADAYAAAAAAAAAAANAANADCKVADAIAASAIETLKLACEIKE